MNKLFEAKGLTKSFGDEVVVQNVDMSITRGSIHALVGPNGAGKTTLLKMMAQLIEPSGGQVHWCTDSVFGTTLRQRVHYISPEVHLYPFFRVKDILTYARLLYAAWDEKRCSLLVNAFQIPLHKTVRSLSLGMKMRLRILLALSAHADVLLLDEATNGLDPAATDQVLDLILQESANHNVTVVLATHSLAEVERVADTLSLLVDGRIVVTEHLDTLKTEIFDVHVTVADMALSETLATHPGVFNVTKDGNLLSFRWIGPHSDLEAVLSKHEESDIEIRFTTLERWFESAIEKEGVGRGKIVLPERTSV